ncbi:MAG: NAD-dependent deacylase [Bacteroidaceae bacterium]|nr:NAD-dependent deacylase [Bacteroidaceae bacterium]
MKKLVFLTGAGMSVDSGFATFRGANGLWGEYRVEDVASIEGYWRNPSLVIDFYNQLRKQLVEASPNEGHQLVASLEEHFDTTVVTQNVDNLHERAGSTNVIHLHGELMKVTSTNNPNDPRCIETLTPEGIDIHIGDKAKDGSQLRPFIVWFGEAVPKMEEAAAVAMQADIFVVIGTSFNVYPAASLISYVPKNAKIYLIDPNPVKVPYGIDVHIIQQRATEGMRELKEMLLSQE